MLHGKKGFERIVWAFKNVLTQSVTWLFHDFNSSTEHGKTIAIAPSKTRSLIVASQQKTP